MRAAYRDVTLAVEDGHWWYRGRRRVVRAVLERLPLPSPASVLDVGCGGGASLPELARLGSVVGVEPAASARALANARGVAEVVAGEVEALPFERGSFDVAAALDVLEHLDDDRLGFEELRRVTRPGGYLVVTVPAYPRLWGPHDVVNEHRRRYVRSTLLRAAEPARWRPVTLSYFNTILLPPAAVHRWRDSRRGVQNEAPSDFERTPPWLDGVLELPLRAEAAALRAGVRLPAGLSLIGAFQAVGR
jgi:SAM-dependent methyltransferase